MKITLVLPSGPELFQIETAGLPTVGYSKPIWEARASEYLNNHPLQGYSKAKYGVYHKFIFNNVKLESNPYLPLLIFPAVRKFDSRFDSEKVIKIKDQFGNDMAIDGAPLVWTLIVGFKDPVATDIGVIPKKASGDDVDPDNPEYWEHPTSIP